MTLLEEEEEKVIIYNVNLLLSLEFQFLMDLHGYYRTTKDIVNKVNYKNMTYKISFFVNSVIY